MRSILRRVTGSWSLRVFLWVAFMLVLIDMGSRLGLFLLRVVRGIEYEPTPYWSLCAEDRQIVEAILGGGFICDVTFDKDLGWRLAPGVRSDDPGVVAPSHYSWSTNAQGLRGPREYLPEVPPGMTRILAFGDSFTYCAGVDDDDTWEAQMEKLDRTIEVLNFGVGGYGTDQALLRFQSEAGDWQGDFVFIGFHSDDIMRHVNVFRPFLSPHSMPYSKPRFVMHGGKLELLENPIQNVEDYRRLLGSEAHEFLEELGSRDCHFRMRYYPGKLDWVPAVRFAKVASHALWSKQLRAFHDGPYNPQSETYTVTVGILDRFVEEVQLRGLVPIVLMLPGCDDVRAWRDEGQTSYQILVDDMEARGHETVDLVEALGAGRGEPVEAMFDSTAHYSQLGNQRVAVFLHHYLQERSYPGQ